MSNKKVVKRASGSSRNARRNRERRAYRTQCRKLEAQLMAAERRTQTDKETIADLRERVNV